MWVNEINTDTVVRLIPANDEMRVVQLPSRNTGIRKMIVETIGKSIRLGHGPATLKDRPAGTTRSGERRISHKRSYVHSSNLLPEKLPRTSCGIIG